MSKREGVRQMDSHVSGRIDVRQRELLGHMLLPQHTCAVNTASNSSSLLRKTNHGLVGAGVLGDPDVVCNQLVT